MMAEDSIAFIERRIKERDQARREKNYEEADEIRDHLLRNGVILEDKENITTWRWK